MIFFFAGQVELGQFRQLEASPLKRFIMENLLIRDHFVDISVALAPVFPFDPKRLKVSYAGPRLSINPWRAAKTIDDFQDPLSRRRRSGGPYPVQSTFWTIITDNRKFVH
jgi:hypothetical protein